MSRRSDVNDLQFDLELPQAPKPDHRSASVVRFIDSETRALRQEAIERVRLAGIFEPPKKYG